MSYLCKRASAVAITLCLSGDGDEDMEGEDWYGLETRPRGGSCWSRGSSESRDRWTLRRWTSAGLVWAATIVRRRRGIERVGVCFSESSVAGASDSPVFSSSSFTLEGLSSSSPESTLARMPRARSSPASTLRRFASSSSARPCCKATWPITSVSAGIAGTPARTRPIPTTAGST